MLKDALVGNETANFEFVLKSKFGHTFTVLLNATTRRERGDVRVWWVSAET